MQSADFAALFSGVATPQIRKPRRKISAGKKMIPQGCFPLIRDRVLSLSIFSRREVGSFSVS
jgi:hypothetical protein